MWYTLQLDNSQYIVIILADENLYWVCNLRRNRSTAKWTVLLNKQIQSPCSAGVEGAALGGGGGSQQQAAIRTASAANNRRKQPSSNQPNTVNARRMTPKCWWARLKSRNYARRRKFMQHSYMDNSEYSPSLIQLRLKNLWWAEMWSFQPRELSYHIKALTIPSR